ncbi:MAG: DUF4173 domain-containing protein [Chitinophagaceae bacterium]|nr:MAG: DUF4173 domain-containing protein [Chitinophagaceae bacterium]
MNITIDSKLIYALIGGLLFNFLFWNEELAFNLVIYSLFTLSIYLIDHKLFESKKLFVVSLSHVLACAFILINHSVLTILTWYTSLLVLVGYTHTNELRSIFMAVAASFLQFASAPFILIRKISTTQIAGLSFKPVLKLIKYLIIPSVILIVFSVIYSTANPFFDSYITTGFRNLGDLINTIFSFFFKDISIGRIAFLAGGIVFSTGVLMANKNKLAIMESVYQDNLLRVRRDRKKQSNWREISTLISGNLINRKMALKTENTIAILSFMGLNLLLLFLNSIDISTLWMGNLGSLNFSKALHGSTNALIVSILMAMAVILYFFNGNLNYYSKNKTIRLLAYLWIIQNTFLIFSVLLRDYHYIAMHGLTYKRIGVIVFSVLCVIGLLTVYLKVANRKSFFFLFKTNGAIWYVLLLLSGAVNWDVFIVGYNINHRNSATLDVGYLMRLSDKTLPKVIEDKELLKRYLSPTNSPYQYVTKGSTDTTAMKKLVIDSTEIKRQIRQSLAQTFELDLAKRIVNFKENQQKRTWLSWNYRDWQTEQYLNELK